MKLYSRIMYITVRPDGITVTIYWPASATVISRCRFRHWNAVLAVVERCTESWKGLDTLVIVHGLNGGTLSERLSGYER